MQREEIDNWDSVKSCVFRGLGTVWTAESVKSCVFRGLDTVWKPKRTNGELSISNISQRDITQTFSWSETSIKLFIVVMDPRSSSWAGRDVVGRPPTDHTIDWCHALMRRTILSIKRLLQWPYYLKCQMTLHTITALAYWLIGYRTLVRGWSLQDSIHVMSERHLGEH